MIKPKIMQISRIKYKSQETVKRNLLNYKMIQTVLVSEKKLPF